MSTLRRRTISLRKFFAGVLLLFLVILFVESALVVFLRVRNQLRSFGRESQTFMRVCSLLLRKQVLDGGDYVYSVLRGNGQDRKGASVPIIAVLSEGRVLRSLKGWLPDGFPIPKEILNTQWHVNDLLDARGHPLLTGVMHIDGKDVFVAIRLDFSELDIAGAEGALPIVAALNGQVLWAGDREDISDLSAHIRARGVVIRQDMVKGGWFPLRSYSGRWLFVRQDSFLYGLRLLLVYPVETLLLSAFSGLVYIAVALFLGLCALFVLRLVWTKGVYEDMHRIGATVTEMSDTLQELDAKDYAETRNTLFKLSERFSELQRPFVREMIPFVENLRTLFRLIFQQQRGLTLFSGKLERMNMELTDLNERLRVREELWEQLLEFSHSFSMSSDVAGTLKTTLDRVRQDTGAFGVLLSSVEKGYYRNLASSGYEDGLQNFCISMEGIAATESIKKGGPLWIEDISQFPGATAVHPKVKSELLVPLFQTGEEEGVLEIAFDRVTERDPFVVETVTPVASFLGGLIYGANKRREVEESYAYLAEKLQLVTGIYHGETEIHIARIGAYSRVLAAELGRSREEQDQIALFARLHDIGKLKVPKEILSKPGKLTAEELAVIRKHPEWGAEILGDAPWLAMARSICLTHHERWDGSGYPRGLKGDEIPWEGQVVAIADVYDALRSRRSYKEPLSHEKSVETIVRSEDGTLPGHFDPKLIAAFFRVADRLAVLFDTARDT